MESTAAIQDPHHLWKKTCDELLNLISPDAFKRWFQPIRALSCDTSSILLGIENSITQYWIEENYLGELRQSLHLASGREMKVEFSLSESPAAAKSAPIPSKSSSRSKSSASSHRSDLVERYLFDSFVVGTGNQFAHAASMAVADAPARTYNPLFIHGSVGLGKTHLMHAIGHRVLERKKDARIVYVTSEQFTNEFITAIQMKELVRFRRRYRQADVLFIDDVQFLGGKERSQEEFFHTFNALFEGSKQIVMTCDCPPSEVKNLEQRLVSRFEWGLTAELQPPDIETRMAILRSKAAKMNVRLGDSILLFIAENIKANVRRLEGALNRVAAWAALNDRHITQSQVEDLLRDFIQQESRQAVTIEIIQRRVAESFDIRLTDMTSKRRPNNIAIPRMVAMYLSRQRTGKSLQDIGDSFGGRDHGTVIHACKKIEEKMEQDPSFRQQVSYICQRLETASRD